MALPVELHPYARGRAIERGATEEEIVATVNGGERFAAKLGRTGFRRNFTFDGLWRGRRYGTKQVEAIAVVEAGHWLVLTIWTRYF